MYTLTVAALVAVVALASQAQGQGITCHTCQGASDEALCMAAGTTKQCNPNQVCQTSVRCTPSGVSIKKSCIGRSRASSINADPVCQDDSHTSCGLFCDSELCNAVSVDSVVGALQCPVKPEGVTCHSCYNASSEAECLAEGQTEQCNPNQVCQTIVRCLSDGIFVKKGCSSTVPADQATGEVTCTDSSNTKCGIYCDGDMCNSAGVDDIGANLACPVRAVGVTCHSCYNASSEEECLALGTTEQCYPNQVCQTFVRCLTEGVFVKKGCQGSVPDEQVDAGVICEDDTNTKCALYCKDEMCNTAVVDTIASQLACPVKAIGPLCRSCYNASSEEECDEGEIVQCYPSQVCQTTIRCLYDGSAFIRKGCGAMEGALTVPDCEDGTNNKCSYRCDSDYCSDNTADLIGSVLACPVPGNGPICTVCDDAADEDECNLQNPPKTCYRNQVCFAKVVCDRPAESVRFKKRCIGADQVPTGTLNQITCENIDNCSLACDSDYCNTDTADLFQTLECPVKPPRVMCKKCVNVYDEDECEDISCRDGNFCFAKVVCERRTGLFRYSKRCIRGSRVLPEHLDTVTCDRDNRCYSICTGDNCNDVAQPLVDRIQCDADPDAVTTPMPPLEFYASTQAAPGPDDDGTAITCKKCSRVYDESECQDVTCRENQLCFSKVICERKTGRNRFSKRCIRASRVHPADVGEITCDRTNRCFSVCDGNNCNAVAQPLIDGVSCAADPDFVTSTPMPPIENYEPTTPLPDEDIPASGGGTGPGITCKACSSVYDENQCQDLTCRDDEMCFAKVVCEGRTGRHRFSKRCIKERRVNPADEDEVMCDRDNRCFSVCDGDNCNADAGAVAAEVSCVADPDAVTTPMPPLEMYATTEMPANSPPSDGAGSNSGTGTDMGGDSAPNCQCHCSCAPTCEAPYEAWQGCEVGQTRSLVLRDGRRVLVPDVQGFDGETLQLFTANRFTIAKTVAPIAADSPCKLRVDVKTSEDDAGVTLKAVHVQIDAADADAPDTDSSIALTITMAKRRLVVRVGQQAPTPVKTFPYKLTAGRTTVEAEKALMEGGVRFTLTGGVAKEEGGLVAESCQWRVEYYQPPGDGPRTLRLAVNQGYAGSLQGLCGNNNAVAEDDLVGCGLNDWRRGISDSCVTGP